MAARRWEYRVLKGQDLRGPMDFGTKALEDMLNRMDGEGWEFVGGGAEEIRSGSSSPAFEFWVFRRPVCGG